MSGSFVGTDADGMHEFDVTVAIRHVSPASEVSGYGLSTVLTWGVTASAGSCEVTWQQPVPPVPGARYRLTLTRIDPGDPT